MLCSFEAGKNEAIGEVVTEGEVFVVTRVKVLRLTAFLVPPLILIWNTERLENYLCLRLKNEKGNG